jgi:hypothetical protein
MMIVVAIVCLLLSCGIGAVGLVRRSRHFRESATYHAGREQFYLRSLPFLERTLKEKKEDAEHFSRLSARDRHLLPNPRGFPDDSTRSVHEQVMRKREQFVQEIEKTIRWMTSHLQFQRSLAAYHAEMKQKYERAASHPWEPVPPDPPLPTLPATPPEPQEPAEPLPPPKEPRRRIDHLPLITQIPGSPTLGKSLA